MATHPVKRHCTLEEYLAYELETDIRHEFIDGEIFAMAGGTRKHNIITYNVSGELRNQLRQSKSCQGYESNMRIRITDIRYVYPDMTVVCGEAIFSDEEETMLTNPTLVVEVLSPSTEKYDKSTKLDFYRSLPSVQAYLIVAQDRPHAMLYTREKSGWHLEDYHGLETIVPLEAIGCELKLCEVYLNVDGENEAQS